MGHYRNKTNFYRRDGELNRMDYSFQKADSLRKMVESDGGSLDIVDDKGECCKPYSSQPPLEVKACFNIFEGQFEVWDDEK